MLLRNSAWSVLVAFLVSGCAISKFDGTNASLRNALLQGKIKDALANYEVEAKQAENNAVSSSSPQRYWSQAVGAYLQAADAARFSGQLQKAIIYGEKALDIVQKPKVSVSGRTGRGGKLMPAPVPELAAIGILIATYRTVRNFDNVRALAEKGLRLLKENPNIGRFQRLSHEGALYAALGDDRLRRGEYEKAIDALSQAVSVQRAALSMSGLAGSGRGRGPKAREGARLKGENSEVGLGDALVKLARAFRLAGRFDDALARYREAFNRVSAGGTTAVLAQDVYLGVGEVYLQQKKASLAIESFQKALALAEAEQRTVGINSASAGLGASYRQASRATEAIPYYQKAIQQTESTRSLLQSDDYRQSFFEGGLNAYFGIIESLSESGKADEAFSFSERARSRSFLDLLGSKTQLSRVAGGFRDEEQALHQRIAGMKALLSAQVDEDDDDDEEESEDIDAATLRNQLAEAETAYSNFLLRVKKEDKEQASLMNVEPLTLKQTQELLEPGVTLLEYFITNDSVLVWIVDKGTVSSVTVSLSRKELQAKVAALRESISQLEEMAKLNQQAQDLFKSLIQPALPHIRGKELLIIPHDVLHYLPFQALLSPSGKYLIEDYPINYLSSASLMQFTQEKRKAKGELTAVIAQGGQLLTFGNPALNDPKMALQFAEIEAKEIKTLYPQSSIYLQKEATEERAKSLSPQNDIIHFASHAELNEDDPLASAILLAKSDKEDGRLEVREIFGMDLKASLVVLSACETGLGKLSSGDELVGLTRAFIYAGTPSVVASLWNVEDSSTAQLMASFYKNLKTMTKVEALRQAQLNLIRGNVNSDLLARRGIGGVGKLGEVPAAKSPSQNSVSISTSHPFFWAPFILVGEGK